MRTPSNMIGVFMKRGHLGTEIGTPTQREDDMKTHREKMAT